jgi:hypothetical protein
MAVRREYKGNASATTIAADITSSATTLTLADAGIAANWPTGPSYAVIGKGTALEESVLFTRASVTLTITRAQNDTTAVGHSAGASIEHVWTKTDADEANAHIAVPATGEADHSTLLNNTRHDDATRHSIGTTIATGTSATSSHPGDTASPGSAAALSLSDHLHGREPYGTAGNVTTSNPGDTAAAGTVDAIARIDHKHAREAPGGGGAPLTYGTPGASAVGDTAAQGSNAAVARSDHRHGREGFGNVATQNLMGAAAANGSATTVARSDHVHGTPSVYPVSSANTTPITTTSTSFTATSTVLSVDITVKATQFVIIIVGAGQNTDGNFTALTSFTLSGANTRAANDREACSVNGTNNIRGDRMTTLFLNPGATTVTMVHRVNGAATGTFVDRSIIAIPL